MTTDQFVWVLARVCGLASYASLSIALMTGIALRTAVLDWLGSNRALRSLHEDPPSPVEGAAPAEVPGSPPGVTTVVERAPAGVASPVAAGLTL